MTLLFTNPEEMFEKKSLCMLRSLRNKKKGYDDAYLKFVVFEMCGRKVITVMFL